MVVLGRKQLGKHGKEELIERVTNSKLNSWKIFKSSFQIRWIPWKICASGIWTWSLKNCTKLLSKDIEILQRNALDSWEYLRREMIEINPVPEDIQDMQLEESIC